MTIHTDKPEYYWVSTTPVPGERAWDIWACQDDMGLGRNGPWYLRLRKGSASCSRRDVAYAYRQDAVDAVNLMAQSLEGV